MSGIWTHLDTAIPKLYQVVRTGPIRSAALVPSGRPHWFHQVGRTGSIRSAVLVPSGRPHWFHQVGRTGSIRSAALVPSGRPHWFHQVGRTGSIISAALVPSGRLYWFHQVGRTGSMRSAVLVPSVITSVSVAHLVKTRHNESVTLPCKWRCSGLVRWVTSHRRDDVVAQCDQTSCSSEAGYDMSHAHYLKADLSLTITAADYHQRSWYTCQCDGQDVRDVRLGMERAVTMDLGALEHSVWSRDVKLTVTQNMRRGPRSTRAVTLTDLKQTDRGVYTVWDTENGEIISTYTLTLTGEVAYSGPVLGAVFSLGLVLGVFVQFFILHCFNWVKKQKAQRPDPDPDPVPELVQLKELDAQRNDP
ncbi:hypothetical protein QTP70_032798 [Hemibagrus guttatus]|uniref:Uncharacterized protein n=1 Tax=Hemibagrus guttatus TaxID=175788 RepID=A0AAE0Q648_9TELE|nr:hypothetical protein QTP70_032798 [Hemibagrus guttatus]